MIWLADGHDTVKFYNKDYYDLTFENFLLLILYKKQSEDYSDQC